MTNITKTSYLTPLSIKRRYAVLFYSSFFAWIITSGWGFTIPVY